MGILFDGNFCPSIELVEDEDEAGDGEALQNVTKFSYFFPHNLVEFIKIR